MELMARLQEILGKKIFRDDVTVKGKLVAKNGMEVYAEPVPSEGSWGTFHQHVYNLVTNYDPASTPTNLTVDCSSQVPVGTKGIFAVLFGMSATAGRSLQVASGGALGYIYIRSQVANIHITGSGYVPLTSSRTFVITADNADWSQVYCDMTGYFI
jgi:hypothetical protein